MQQKINDIIFNTDDITWKSMIFDVIKKENMSAWDVDVKVISDKFLEMLKNFKKMDFKISGKVILASAFLLKMKSDRFLKEDFSKFDEMLEETKEQLEDNDDDYNYYRPEEGQGDRPYLVPRTPQPRKRKVSIFDLVNALEQALEVKDRRTNRLSMLDAPDVVRPIKKFDITKGIEDLYGKIQDIFNKTSNQRINFLKLIPGDSREEKIYTFIPLLHLSNQRKVDLFQETHFGAIEIEYLKDNKIKLEEIKPIVTETQ